MVVSMYMPEISTCFTRITVEGMFLEMGGLWGVECLGLTVVTGLITCRAEIIWEVVTGCTDINAQAVKFSTNSKYVSIPGIATLLITLVNIGSLAQKEGKRQSA